MNREEIIRMGREAGAFFDDDDCLDDCAIEIWARFAALVAAAEREACLGIVDDNTDGDGVCCADDLLAAIRARGQE